MKKYIGAALSLSSVGMLFYIIFNQKEQIATLTSTRPNVDSLHHVIDSLKSEIFVKEIEVGRYEIIFDRAEAEMTPECKEELETIKHTIE
jgi:hypothetical protein